MGWNRLGRVLRRHSRASGDDVERSKIANGVVPFYELYPQENEVVVTSLPVAQNSSV